MIGDASVGIGWSLLFATNRRGGRAGLPIIPEEGHQNGTFAPSPHGRMGRFPSYELPMESLRSAQLLEFRRRVNIQTVANYPSITQVAPFIGGLAAVCSRRLEGCDVEMSMIVQVHGITVTPGATDHNPQREGTNKPTTRDKKPRSR